MFPESMKSFIDMAATLGDFMKRVERLETLEAANVDNLCNCWCPITYDPGQGAKILDVPDHTPDYPSYVVLYALYHDAVDVLHDITLELNAISTNTYEYIYLRLDNNLVGAFEVQTATAQPNIIIGKAPPDNVGTKWASGIIFFPYAGEQNTPIIALNACYNDQDVAGSRLSAGIYFGDNSGHLASPLTRIKIDVPGSFIKNGWAGLYEICQKQPAGG